MGSSNAEKKDTFCHLSVFGPTTHRFNGLDSNCNRVLCYRDLRHDLEPLKSDDSVKKVFIEFNGPGGEAEGCFDLADYIAELGKIKPVIGFINGSSYSANYALACACNELYASPYSMGGSIGAIYGRREIMRENETVTYFKTGDAKADGTPDLALDENESGRHQAMVDQLGDSFFALVANNRGVDAKVVKALQAGLFNSQALLNHGLIDGIKTEEEIKTMMTNAGHQKIVDSINATHALEKTELTTQITELQSENQKQQENQLKLSQKIMNLATSAGVPELAAELIVDDANEIDAAKKIKIAAAAKDEELLLTSGLDTQGNEAYDMQQLIRDA